jgi:type I restriction enzyme, S subunit
MKAALQFKSLPEGWVEELIGSFCDVKHGFAFDSTEFSSDVPPGNPLVITPGNFTEDGRLLFNEKNTKRFRGVTPSDFRFNVGDLVVVMTDLSAKMKILGKPAFVEMEHVLHNQRIGRVVFLNDRIEKRFLYYFMLSERFLKSIKESATGTMVRHTAPKRILNNLIQFPSNLKAQQRIIGILDDAFDGIATAKATAEKNLQNARALFESHLQAVFTQRGEGWVEKRLETLCSLFVDSAHRTPKYQEEGIPALRPRDVVNGRLALSEAARVSKDEYEIQTKRYKPNPGDIVYSRELSYGWAAILPESPRICLSQGMCIFRPIPNLDSTFLFYVLNSPTGRKQAGRAAVGAAHPHINLGDIKSYLIPFPPLGQQKRITQQLDAIAAETQRLESIYRQKLVALEELKKSLLHQAFTGNL